MAMKAISIVGCGAISKALLKAVEAGRLAGGQQGRVFTLKRVAVQSGTGISLASTS